MEQKPYQSQKNDRRPARPAGKQDRTYQQNRKQPPVQVNPNQFNPNRFKNQPPKDPKDARHFEVTPSFKAYFIDYCKEKAEAARKRIQGIHEELSPFMDSFLEQYPLFFSLQEEDALRLFGEPQPKDGAENLVSVSFKLTSRLQAYSSAAVEYYAYTGLIQDIEGVTTTESLFIQYNQVNPEQTYTEKVLGSKRRFLTKACNFAEQKLVYTTKAAKGPEETTDA